jgi:transposase-like protein
MTNAKNKPAAAIKELLSQSPDGLREIVRAVMQEMLEAEMTDALQAEKGERTATRLGYRSGYCSRTLVTRVGKPELRVPQDRDGRFSTELFERYQRSEQALVATLAEMYVQGVSTRKVKAIAEELCGHSFSASAISAINKRLDDSLAQFTSRRLEEPFPSLILDARYEKVREGGIVASQAVLIAVGIDWDGRRQILGVEMANRESQSSWRTFLLGLRERGLSGVELVVADDHAGGPPSVRCCPKPPTRGAMCTSSGMPSRLVAWAEETIEETLTFYRLPRQHHKSTNMLERLNEEIRRRTYVVRIFPNAAGWCGPWRWRRMRTGSRRTAISTWRIWRSTRKPLLAKPLSQPDRPPRFAELDAHNP